MFSQTGNQDQVDEDKFDNKEENKVNSLNVDPYHQEQRVDSISSCVDKYLSGAIYLVAVLIIMFPPRPEGRHIVFGSVGVVISVVCVVPCECDNFSGVLNFTFKLEPSINHMNFSDKFENW